MEINLFYILCNRPNEAKSAIRCMPHHCCSLTVYMTSAADVCSFWIAAQQKLSIKYYPDNVTDKDY